MTSVDSESHHARMMRFALMFAAGLALSMLPTDAHAACKTGSALYAASEEWFLDYVDNPAIDCWDVGDSQSNCSPWGRWNEECGASGYPANWRLEHGTSCPSSTFMYSRAFWKNGSVWDLYGNWRCHCPSGTTVCGWI